MANTVVITGANRGIGLALTEQYLQRGDNVIAVCRQSSKALTDTPATIIAGIDVTDEACIQQLATQLQDTSIDILINNAGVLESERLGDIDYDNVLKQFLVNAVSPLRVTEALIPCLNTNSKVAVVTSRMGSIADNGSGGYYGYRMSKAALNAAAVSLTHDLKPKGVAVAILHPGFVQTDMVGHAGDITAKTSANRLAQRIDQLDLSRSGTFWHSNGDVLPW